MPPRMPGRDLRHDHADNRQRGGQLEGGDDVRHRGREAQLEQGLRPRRGVAVHQFERGRRRRLEATERADGDREERQERGEHAHRRPARPLPAEHVEASAPADDLRGERDQWHRLRHDHPGQQSALGDSEAGHQHRQADADRLHRARARRATSGTCTRRTPRPSARSDRRRHGSRVRRDVAPCPRCAASPGRDVFGMTRTPSTEPPSLGPDELVELPAAPDEGERDAGTAAVRRMARRTRRRYDLASFCSSSRGMMCSPYSSSVWSLPSCWR